MERNPTGDGQRWSQFRSCDHTDRTVEESSRLSQQLRPLHSTPNVMVTVEDEQCYVCLIDAKSGSLRVKEIADAGNNKIWYNRYEIAYAREKCREARWFMEAIEQRERNLLKLMEVIVCLQKEYFLTGDVLDIQPMVLKEVAHITQLDISTISRLTANKYATTPFGTVFLKSLFGKGIVTSSGKMSSTKNMQSELEQIIKAEDKYSPLSDQDLTAILKSKGYVVARRTVTKYRKKLAILPCKMRCFDTSAYFRNSARKKSSLTVQD